MSLNRRSYAILQELVQREYYVSIEELMDRFKVSKRTIYYEIDQINYWLEQRQIKSIKHERSRGFYMAEVPVNFAFLNTFPYEYSVEERIAWIALHLLISEQRLLIKDFEDWLDVSRNTVIDDLKKLKTTLNDQHLSLTFHRQEGYILHGNEIDKRKVIMYYLSYFLSHQRNKDEFLQQIGYLLNTVIDLNPIFHILSQCEEELQIHYTDADLYQLSLQIFLNVRRIVRRQHIQMDTVEKSVIVDTAEFQAAKKGAHLLSQKYQVQFPEDEVFYLTTYLLSAKLQHKYKVTAPNSKLDSLKKVISHMVEDFQLYAGVVFQDRQEFEANLLIHLEPAFYRSKYGLKLQNPLTELIKEKYQDIYYITKKVIHYFEKFTEQKLQDNEIAFIAIHFGGWLRKEGQKPIIRKKALIICNSGLGTSGILRSQLEQLFPTVDFYRAISAREYEKESNWPDVSFAISTVAVDEKGHPLFVIRPILTSSEKNILANKVHAITGVHAQTIQQYSIDVIMDIVKRHANNINEQELIKELKLHLQTEYSTNTLYRPSLTQLLEGNIQIIHSVKNWQEAIHLASQPLLQKNMISEKYIEAMIHYIEEKGPYMIIAPGIALPHARPEEGVLNVGMSLLVIKQPVAFSKKAQHYVEMIIVLASTDQETHLRAMSELNVLLSNENHIKRIKNSETIDEVWSYLN